MKKLILTALATSFGISLFAQATLRFDNDVPGYPAPVFRPTGIPLAGPTFLAQLMGAPGYNVPESGLLPGSPPTSFRSGAGPGGGAGFVVPTISTFMNIPLDAPTATIEMVAWDNSSGLYPTWSQASFAWLNGLIAAGTSGTWNQDGLGGTLPAPYMINSTDPTQRVRSFTIHVPEPTTAALAGLGAAALLTLRRRSSPQRA